MISRSSNGTERETGLNILSFSSVRHEVQVAAGGSPAKHSRNGCYQNDIKTEEKK